MTAPLPTRLSLVDATPPVRAMTEAEATPEQWNDWQWQLRHRIQTGDDLARFIDLTDDERAGVALAPSLFRLGATPYYASLMDRGRPDCPVRMQVVPRPQEAHTSRGEYVDPLGEDARSPTDAVVHKYPDRALLLALDRCAVYCRHCNRRRMVGQDDGVISKPALTAAIEYIARTPAIKDVIVSGGDPLTLGNDKLEWILSSLRAIEHVEIIRLGTRVPVCLPMRIDDALCALLKRFHPLYVNTHFNHPKELTPAAKAACEKLADAGIPIGNQCVLLRGVNSQPRTIEVLNRALLRARVRPYYLFQGDPVSGTDHLRTPVEAGVAIMDHLRGRMSGLGIPTLVIDGPGGEGKIPIGPDYVVSRSDDAWQLRSWQHHPVEYVQPKERDCTCTYDDKYFGD